MLLAWPVLVLRDVVRQRWSDVSVKKSVCWAWMLWDEKAEVEKRDEKGFLLLERESESGEGRERVGRW